MVHKKLKAFFDELNITEEQEDTMLSILSEVYLLEMTNKNLSEEVSNLSWYKNPDRMGK